MITKEEIVSNWLPRYTGTALKDFGKYILLTNFSDYVNRFSKLTGAKIMGEDRPMSNATNDGVSIINFE